MPSATTSSPPGPVARALKSVALREREVRDTLWLLVATTWILLPHFAILPLWCGVTVAALLVWRTWVTWAGKRLPPRIALIALMCVAGLAVYAQYRTIFGKDAGVAFLVLLLGLKLLEMRARRDIFVVIYLCLFVMLTGFFESQTIAVALGMAVGLLLLVTALISVNFIESEPSYAAKLKLAGQLCLYAMPLMAALFVLFPRVQGPLWGLPADAYARKTGLSDSMSPGSFGKLAESDEMAFRVRFSGALPSPSERYWRGPVFGSFDGRTWRGLPRFFVVRTPVELSVDRASTLDYTVTLEPQNQPWLMMLDVPLAPPQIAGMQTEIQFDLLTAASRPVSERVRYDARSALRYRVGLNEDSVRLKDWLRLPRGFNPRMLAFAAELQAKGESETGIQATADDESRNRKLIASVLQTIRTQNFVYTLDPPALGRDSIDEFLFDTRRGFCEHYAGAFVALMRALNIPARVVTGYQGGEINPVDGYMEVRQRDAHAWAEVWLARDGWVRIDPTAAVAPERIERGFQQTLGRTQGFASDLIGNPGWLMSLQSQLRFNLDAIGNAWNQWVLGYGTERQSSLLSGFGIGRIDWQTLTIALIAVFGALLAIIGAQLLTRRTKLDPVVELYLKLCDRVAVLASEGGELRGEPRGQPRGLGKRLPHEGPLAYLDRVKGRLPQQLQARAEEAFQTYRQLRYGRLGSGHSAENTAVLVERLKTCLSGLRA